ncbi:hypothetical protein IQ22_00286 [Pseudomonas duriflava]|uniref:Uncharacterized protein n=1 Tax=Pseudomonas duriflava TaxID=459528 RepID=A0A562QQV2_9PSED|nr:hypothetical protein [Pseudomonas duriflava]TWI58580.1 hypothetical protein IQ22_00286 [Pseudomonas duriflava]
MTITITERDETHMSQEARALGLTVWDVYQEGHLVGIYHSRAEAAAYKAEIERAGRSK